MTFSVIILTLVSSASSLLPFLQTVRSLDSKSPTLCIKLCYWWFKHVFPPLHLPATIALSWPHGTEFVGSFLKLTTFSALSFICADSLCTFLRMFRSLYNASSVAGISVTVWTSHTLLASKTLMNWFFLNFFWHVSNTIAQNAARLLVNTRKQRSSGHMFLSLAQVVSQPFFTFSPAKGRRGGTVAWAWGKVGYMVLGIWCEEAAFPSV